MVCKLETAAEPQCLSPLGWEDQGWTENGSGVASRWSLGGLYCSPASLIWDWGPLCSTSLRSPGEGLCLEVSFPSHLEPVTVLPQGWGTLL